MLVNDINAATIFIVTIFQFSFIVGDIISGNFWKRRVWINQCSWSWNEIESFLSDDAYLASLFAVRYTIIVIHTCISIYIIQILTIRIITIHSIIWLVEKVQTLSSPFQRKFSFFLIWFDYRFIIYIYLKERMKLRIWVFCKRVKTFKCTWQLIAPWHVLLLSYLQKQEIFQVFLLVLDRFLILLS